MLSRGYLSHVVRHIDGVDPTVARSEVGDLQHRSLLLHGHPAARRLLRVLRHLNPRRMFGVGRHVLPNHRGNHLFGSDVNLGAQNEGVTLDHVQWLGAQEVDRHRLAQGGHYTQAAEQK